MKKHLLICIVLLALFSIYAVILTFTTQRSITIQPIAINPPLQVTLTHDVEHIYTMDYFNVPNSQYLQMEGNATLLASRWTFQTAYNFTDDTPGDPPTVYSSTACYVIDEYDARDQVVKLYANGSAAQALLEIRNTTEKLITGTYYLWFWLNSTTMDDCYLQFWTGNTETATGFEIYLGKFGSTYGITVFDYDHTQFVTSIDYDCWNFLNVTVSCPDFSLYLNNATCLGTFAFDHNNPATYLDRLLFTSYGQHYIDDINFGGEDGYCAAGSYISPILDLGACNNYYITWINVSFDTFGDSDLGLHIRASVDNETWGNWGDISSYLLALDGHIPLNAEGVRYNQFYFNFTASTDTLQTSKVYSVLLQFEETILNELPQLGDILITFDNDTMEATVACLITDPDADNCTVTLCLPLGDVVDTQTDVVNGTIVEFLVNCTYSTNYQYYLNVTDSEDAVQSSLFGFSTGNEPEEPEEPVRYADIYDYMIAIFAMLLSLAIAAANIPKKV